MLLLHRARPRRAEPATPTAPAPEALGSLSAVFDPHPATNQLPQPPSSAGPRAARRSCSAAAGRCWLLQLACLTLAGSGLAAVAAPNLHPYLCLRHAELSGRRLGVVCRAFCPGVVCVRGDDVARTRQLCLWPLNSEPVVCLALHGHNTVKVNILEAQKST